MSRREQLVEMVLELQGSDANIRLYERLLASVRQERASRVREKESRLIKRFDLKESVCSKLASISRATKRNESKLVEDLILDEAAVRQEESVTLKEQRKKLAEDRRELKKKEGELSEAGMALSRREQDLGQRLDRLTAFERLLNAVIECEVEDLKVAVSVDPGESIESLIEFSSASSPDGVKPLADAWNQVLDSFGKSGGDDSGAG
jgi:hypothetical protein